MLQSVDESVVDFVAENYKIMESVRKRLIHFWRVLLVACYYAVYGQHSNAIPCHSALNITYTLHTVIVKRLSTSQMLL